MLHDLRWVVANIIPAEIERRIARGETPLERATPLDVDMALTELPLATHPLIQEYAAFYLDWLAHPTADDYWLPSAPCFSIVMKASEGCPPHSCQNSSTSVVFSFFSPTLPL